jgi:hypothetical protein
VKCLRQHLFPAADRALLNFTPAPPALTFP